MNDIVYVNGTEIKVNKELEPKNYFEIIKHSDNYISMAELENELCLLAEEISNAKKLGQKSLVEILNFNIRTIIKERIIFKMGLNKFVDRELITEYVKQVKPKASVKIIEMSRYQRVIPKKAAAEIQKFVDANIFDDILILFTDFTKNDYKTKEEKKFLERNRDPIAFGFFKDENTGETHNRFYPITSWEDMHCDLTMDKFISKIGRERVGNLNNLEIILKSYEDEKPSKIIEKLFSWMKK